MDVNNSVYEACGIKDGKIAFLGTNAEAAGLPSAEKIDLKGCLVLPGFNDTHMHAVNCASNSRRLMLDDVKHIGDLKKKIAEFIGTNAHKGVITGVGFNQERLEEKRYPTVSELDECCKDFPLRIYRICGHVMLVNSKSLEIVINSPDYESVRHNVDEENGILKENAMGVLSEALSENSETTEEEYSELIKFISGKLNACGITSAGTNDYFGDWRLISAFRSLDENGELTVRFNLQCCFGSTDELKVFVESGEYGKHSDFFKPGPLKLFTDGSLGAATALLNEHYEGDPHNFGVAAMSESEIDCFISAANELGIQSLSHAIGDKACEWVINAVERALNGRPNTLRHGLIHAQITTPEILERMKNAGMIALIQPVFIEDDMDICEKRIGRRRTQTAYAFKSAVESGIPVSGGSDAPVCSFNVLENIHYAVNRSKLTDELCENVFIPGECLTVREAVRLFTSNAAYATFEEDKKGTLEVGKLADIVVIDRNIFRIPKHEIKNAAVLRTVTGGKTVYFAKAR